MFRVSGSALASISKLNTIRFYATAVSHQVSSLFPISIQLLKFALQTPAKRQALDRQQRSRVKDQQMDRPVQPSYERPYRQRASEHPGRNGNGRQQLL